MADEGASPYTTAPAHPGIKGVAMRRATQPALTSRGNNASTCGS